MSKAQVKQQSLHNRHVLSHAITIQLKGMLNRKQIQQCGMYNLLTAAAQRNMLYILFVMDQQISVSSFSRLRCNGVGHYTNGPMTLTSLAIMFVSCRGCELGVSAAQLCFWSAFPGGRQTVQ